MRHHQVHACCVGEKDAGMGLSVLLLIERSHSVSINIELR
jgi:hypothetical protein